MTDPHDDDDSAAAGWRAASCPRCSKPMTLEADTLERWAYLCYECPSGPWFMNKPLAQDDAARGGEG